MDIIKRAEATEHNLRDLAANPLGPRSHRLIRECADDVRILAEALRAGAAGQCRAEHFDTDNDGCMIDLRCQLDAGHTEMHEDGDWSWHTL